MKSLFFCLQSKRKKYTLPGPRRFESILKFIDYGDDVMENVHKKANEIKKGYLHPFIVVALLDNKPHKFYLSIFDCIHQFEGFLASLDYLLKSFFVFNIKYPVDGYNVLLFLQQFIYSIYLSEDEKYAAVIDFIECFNEKRSQYKNM